MIFFFPCSFWFCQRSRRSHVACVSFLVALLHLHKFTYSTTTILHLLYRTSREYNVGFLFITEKPIPVVNAARSVAH